MIEMGTRLNIKELREYLIDIYKRIINGENVKEEAKKVFRDYGSSDRFISENLQRAINFLEDVGWNIPQEVSHLPKSPREFALEILESLKKEEKNPPREWFREVYK
jgi:hypothetical protein